MSEIECPKCGRSGNVPKDKLTSRLVCKKCNSVFHMTPTGRAVLGEMPDHRYEVHHAQVLAAEKKLHTVDSVVDFNPGRTGTLVGILAIGLLAIAALFYFEGGSGHESLGDKSATVAKALADDDVNFVMNNAGKEGEQETTQWFANVKAVLSDMKRESAEQKLEQRVLVIEEDVERKSGQIEVAYLQIKGTSRSEQIAKEAGAKGNGRTTLTVPIYWVYDGSHWLIDGKRTLMASSNMH